MKEINEKENNKQENTNLSSESKKIVGQFDREEDDTNHTIEHHSRDENIVNAENLNHGTKNEDNQGEEKKVEKTEASIEEALKEIGTLKEAWARERAEFMNYRKRIGQERQKQVEDNVANFLSDLLPALDNLDQVLSIKTESPEGEQFREGISMIQKKIRDILQKKDIHVFHPLDEEFNPQGMEAIAFEERVDLNKDTIIEVYQPGYFQQGDDGKRNFIRAARVRVGKPVSQK